MILKVTAKVLLSTGAPAKDTVVEVGAPKQQLKEGLVHNRFKVWNSLEDKNNNMQSVCYYVPIPDTKEYAMVNSLTYKIPEIDFEEVDADKVNKKLGEFHIRRVRKRLAKILGISVDTIELISVR